MSEWLWKDTPKYTKYTIRVCIESLQENWCEALPYLNELICSLCQKSVGQERPLGIGFGRMNDEQVSHGMRFCYRCFDYVKNTAKEEKNG